LEGLLFAKVGLYLEKLDKVPLADKAEKLTVLDDKKFPEAGACDL
jgi:hypothetical protein